MPKTVAVLGDIHVPYHDPIAIKCALHILNDLQPDEVVLIGDIIDFYPVSKYMKCPSRMNSLQEDIDLTHSIINEIVEASPRSKYTYIEGNHEDRLKRFLLTKAPELYCLRVLTVHELLRLKDFKMKYTNTIGINDVTYTHGHIVRKHSAYTARAMSEEYGNVIFGHTHRLGSHYRKDGRGDVRAFENGCLSNIEPDYVSGFANWQQGMSIVTYAKGHFGVEQIQIVDGHTVFRNQWW